MEHFKEEKVTLLALLDKLTNIVCGVIDEKDIDDNPLPFIIYSIQRENKILEKDYNNFVKKKNKIYSILQEMESNLKRVKEISKRM